MAGIAAVMTRRPASCHHVYHHKTRTACRKIARVPISWGFQKPQTLRTRTVEVRSEAEPESEPAASDDEEVSADTEAKEDVASEPPKTAYIDELEEPKRNELTDSMKERMRMEYEGLGGSENTPMAANYFLWIIVIVSFLALAAKLSGAI